MQRVQHHGTGRRAPQGEQRKGICSSVDGVSVDDAPSSLLDPGDRAMLIRAVADDALPVVVGGWAMPVATSMGKPH